MSLKVLCGLALTLVFFSTPLFAQEATIIDMKGTVLVRDTLQSPWRESTLNMTVGSEASIKTVGDSFCVLAFDKNRMNILTIKDHTEIKVNSVIPGNVFLSEGRVFTLIKNISENKNFEVRTPTAVSGARGTGWLTEVIAGETRIACFDDVVYVDSLNDSGEVTGQIDLSQGMEIKVEEKGVTEQDVKEVPRVALQEWKNFQEGVHNFALPPQPGGKTPDGKVLPPLPPPTHGKGQQPLPPLPDQPPKPNGGQPPPEQGTDSLKNPPPEPPQGPPENFGPDHNHGNDGYADAQQEVNQTISDHKACAPFCCPGPNCCDPMHGPCPPPPH